VKTISSKIVIFALLASGAAQAASSFEAQLANVPEFLFESKNYSAKYVNQDQSISIVSPKFSDPAGSGALHLSSNSNMDGVCNLFGQGAFIPNSKVDYYARKGSSVVINQNSQFERFDSNEYTYTIGVITCSPPNPVVVPTSENLEGRFSNDDGSTTIKNPKFKMTGSNLFISSKSDLNGVCKLYGLTAFVANSKIDYYARSGLSVRVGAKMHFQQFDSNEASYAIGSLICR
jgi:hypothetical protein